MANSLPFSIIIPTWNNLPYLKCCIDSIKKNSVATHQIIVHVNEGIDGTRDWLDERRISYSDSKENIGICKAVNLAANFTNCEYIVYLNDDMYVLPGWDVELSKAINSFNETLFMLSSTMIEPVDTGNKSVIVNNYGATLETFNEQALLTNTLQKLNWNGASWPPVLISKKAWDLVGGFSEAFSPGMYSDPDLSMKLWQKGCRNFMGVGNSLVYHFQCKSTGKVKKNDGRKQFIAKWGLSAKAFYKYYLKMGTAYNGALITPKFSIGLCFEKIKGRFLQKRYRKQSSPK